MSGGSRATLSQGLGAARRLFGAMLAVMALLLMTAAFGGEAKACPPGTKADSARSLSHTVKKVAASTAGMVWVTNRAARIPATLRACCGGSHSGGPACQGACSSCTIALAVTGAVALSPAAGTAYGAFEPDGLPPAKVPPEFRPPRRMA